ncbi:hypothetical protein BDD12DRAFT_805955 [Trichophaea hybrida]|nr:hypothetical protein BDD12DRAFT_805955 [Trichophaea hybrida]
MDMEGAPTGYISSNDATDSPESDGEYVRNHDSGVDMPMEGDVDTPGGTDLDDYVDMEVKKEEDMVEEDKDEDDGKETRTIGQGEMVYISAEDVDTMVDDRAIVIPEQGKEMIQIRPRPRPPVPTPLPDIPDPGAPPPTPETHHLSRLEHIWLMWAQK